MRLRSGLLLILLMVLGLTIRAQVNDNDEAGLRARGAFFKTRIVKSSNPPGKPAGKRPPPRQSTREAIGLGYSFYQLTNGQAVCADPAQDFHSGDRIRLTLEPNIDGYLYVFNSDEQDNEPQMLFPNARLKNGNNLIRAHALYELPSSHNADVELQWFSFDNSNATTEHLYIVVSRQPLAGIPSEAKLLEYCRGKEDCYWQPPTEIWAKLKTSAQLPSTLSKIKPSGQPQSKVEQQSVAEELSLDDQAPPPTVIRLSASAEKDLLVTVVDLKHK